MKLALPSPPVLLGLACAVLGLEVVLLALENRRLEAALAAEPTGTGSERPERPRLAAGDALGSFTLRTAAGELVPVAFDGTHGPSLVLVFAQECWACPLALPAWEGLVPRALAAGARVVGLRLDPGDPREDLLADLPVTVGSLEDASEVPLAQLATVPLTLLLDPDGIVLWARYGALEPAAAGELGELLDGLRVAPAR